MEQKLKLDELAGLILKSCQGQPDDKPWAIGGLTIAEWRRVAQACSEINPQIFGDDTELMLQNDYREIVFTTDSELGVHVTFDTMEVSPKWKTERGFWLAQEEVDALRDWLAGKYVAEQDHENRGGP